MPAVHHVDDRGDDLDLRAGVLGDGGDELQQRDVLMSASFGLRISFIAPATEGITTTCLWIG